VVVDENDADDASMGGRRGTLGINCPPGNDEIIGGSGGFR
jgi:hypothetical protein